MLCLWTTYKPWERSRCTSSATVGRRSRPAHGSSGAAGVPVRTPSSCEVPSTDPAAPPFRARVKPHTDLFTYSRTFGFLFTRSLPGKTKSRHSHRGLRPGGFHPPASLPPWLPWFQHLRCLLPRQDLLPWLSPLPRGSPSPGSARPPPLLCTGAALASDPPVRQPRLPGLSFHGESTRAED